jgi:hypothetical protein
MLSTCTSFLSEEKNKVTKASSSARQKYVKFYIAMICWTIKYAGGTKRKHLHYIDKYADITQSPARVWVHTAGRVKMYGGVEVKIHAPPDAGQRSDHCQPIDSLRDPPTYRCDSPVGIQKLSQFPATSSTLFLRAESLLLEVPSSNLGMAILSCFSSDSPGKCRDSAGTIRVRHDHFLPHQLLSNSSTSYCLSY